MEKILNNFVNLIFILLPLSIALGKFLADLSVVIIGVYFIFSTISNKNYKLYNSNIFKIAIFFWIYCIFVSLISSDIILSLESSLFYGRFIFFSMGIALILQNNEKILKYFLLFLIVTVSIIAIDALFQSINGVSLFGIEKTHSTRVSGIFKDELILGSYLSRLFPLIFLSIPIFYYKNIKFDNLLKLLLIILIGSTIYNAGERSAFAYFFITLILAFILLPNYRRIIIYSISILFISILSISFFQPEVHKRMFHITIKNFEAGYVEHNRIIAFSNQHEAHYQVAWEMFKDKKLFGHGPKLFRVKCKNYNEYGCSTHSHNTYMQLLSETGIIGFLIIFFVFIFICYCLFIHFKELIFKKQKIYNFNKIILLICLFISLFPIIPTGNFFGNWLNTIYYIPIGIILFFNFQIRKPYTNIK